MAKKLTKKELKKKIKFHKKKTRYYQKKYDSIEAEEKRIGYKW